MEQYGGIVVLPIELALAEDPDKGVVTVGYGAEPFLLLARFLGAGDNHLVTQVYVGCLHRPLFLQ